MYTTKVLSSLLYKFLTALLVSALLVTALPVLPAYAAAISVNSNADTVAVNGQCTLREAITNANDDAATNVDCAAGAGNDTITFSAGMTIVLGSSLPTITDVDGLTINGGSNVTISGNFATRIAIVNAGVPATFQNIALTNGYVDGNGGAIYSSGNLTINNVTFTNNRTITTTTNNGGAIYHTTGTLTISGSTFTSNRALLNGGAIYISDGSGIMTISNTTFQTQNSLVIDYGGGIYLNSGTLQVNDSTFTGNVVNIHGAAIYVSNGTLSLNNDTFTSNSADSGGAIYYNAPTLLTIVSSTFNGNQATASTGDGGAINLSNVSASGSISGSTFINNTAADDGGAITNGGMPFTITTSTFQNNSATNASGTSALGGAIRNEATADLTTITRSSFINNTVTQSTTTDAFGGAIQNDGSAFVLANVTFSGNSVSQTNAAGAANAYGGALYTTAGTTIHNVTFSGNSVTESGSGTANGGNIYRFGGIVTLANTIVANGIANGAANNCGGTITNGGNNIDFNGGNNCGAGFSNVNPQLGGLTGSPVYFPINAGSPAIDVGSNAICATAGTTNNQSQNGVTRPQDGNSDGSVICDIGSYEAPDAAPTVLSITRVNPDPTNLASVQFLVTFSESLTGGAASNFSLTTSGSVSGASVTSVSAGPGATRTVTVNTGTGDGTIRLNMANSTGVTDAGGNAISNLPFTAGEVYTIDKTGPLVLSSVRADADPTNASTVNFTVTFNEGVTGVDTTDFSLTTTGTIAGASVTTITGTGATRTVTVNTGTGDGTIRLDITDDDTIIDGSGNPLGGSGAGNGIFTSGQIYTIDRTAPDTFITANPPNPDNNLNPSFSFTGDDGSGSGVASFECEMDGGGFATCSSGSSFVLVANGSHTFRVRAIDNAGNIDPTPASYTWTVDNGKPDVTINQASGQSDPTNVSPINFTVVFSEPVTGFTNADVTLSGTAGATTAIVTEIAPNDGTTYSAVVSGMTSNGTVVASIGAGVAVDMSNNGNNASTSVDNTVTYDTAAPDTVIDSSPSNPSGSADATFDFSSPNSDTVGFECRLDGGSFAACATPKSYTGLSAGSHTFEVRAVDSTNIVDPSPASYTWVIDLGYPVVSSSIPADGTKLPTGLTQITVTFSEDVKVDGSAPYTDPGAVNNPANYLLVEDGGDDAFNTLSCLGGRVADDISIVIDSATYSNGGGGGPFIATLTVNGGIALPIGTYRLYVCGTTSIEDLASNKLNNGLADTQIDFILRGASRVLPKTGFAQGWQTILPNQPAGKAYASTDLWLEIPKFSVKMSIVGVPSTNDGWDVTWLDKNAGWLNGSAYPTWNGNSVLTGHVWDALNKPGPFAQLKNLKYGDLIKIHAFGQIFIYEVRESATVSPTSVSKVFKHEEKSWITLVTCEDYKELSQTYSYRRMVRAVLVSVTAEK